MSIINDYFIITPQDQHNGIVNHGDTIGYYQHERSNTIVVSLTSPVISNTNQVDINSPPHHIQPPAYDQNEALSPVGKLFRCFLHDASYIAGFFQML